MEYVDVDGAFNKDKELNPFLYPIITVRPTRLSVVYYTPHSCLCLLRRS